MPTAVYIISGLALLFFFVGVSLPYFNEDFGSNFNSQDTSNLAGSEDDLGVIGIWDTLVSVFSMFFWTFGGVPVMLDLLFFTPLRLVFWIAVIDLILPG